MTIKALLDRNPHQIVTVSPETNVVEAVTLLAKKRIGALPVLRDGKCVGIFSERDLIYCLEQRGADALSLSVEQVMTVSPVFTEPEATVLSVLSVMTRRRIRHLPVLHNDVMVGFVSIGDLVKYRIDSIEAESNALRQYIQSS